MKKKKNAFTLIELLAIVVVLGIILAIAIPKITESINNSRVAAFEDQKEIMFKVAKDYIQIYGDDDGTNDGMFTYQFLIAKGKLKNGIKDAKGKEIGPNTLIDPLNKRISFVGDVVNSNNNTLSINSNGIPLYSYKIYGNTTQESNPTPTDPKPVVSVGENGTIDVVSSGKNSFDKTKATLNYYINSSNGELISASPYFVTDYIKIESGKTYYWNDSVTRGNQGVYYDTNKNYLSGLNTNGTGKKYFTAPANAVYLRLTGDKAIINSMQLEEGTAATSYETYKEPITTTINLNGLGPLRKMKTGDIVDYIDSSTGKITTRTAKKVLTGDEGWNIHYSDNFNWINGTIVYFTGFVIWTFSSGGENDYGYYSHGYYTNVQNASAYYYPFTPSTAIIRTTWLGISLENSILGIETSVTSSADRITKFRAYLKEKYDSGNPLTIYYTRASNKTDDITLPPIPTHNGTTIITIPNGGTISAQFYHD